MPPVNSAGLLQRIIVKKTVVSSVLRYALHCDFHLSVSKSMRKKTQRNRGRGIGNMSTERLLLIIEDDMAFARTLSRSFERRGYVVLLATTQSEAAALLAQHNPGYAVVDLKLNGNTSGLACVQMLHQHDEAMLIVVLTGFASIGTAVEAIKLGACQYLAKPSNTDDIEIAFGHVAGSTEIELT